MSTHASVSAGSAPGGSRTPNLLIRSQMLYPLSYRRRSTMVPRGLEPSARKSGLLMVMKHAVVVMALILTGSACTSSSSVDRPASSVAIADGPSPSATPVPATTQPPRFRGEVSALDGAARRLVLRRNWHPGCPVPIADLRLVTVSYWDFAGDVRSGPAGAAQAGGAGRAVGLPPTLPSTVPDPPHRPGATAATDRLEQHAQPHLVVQLSRRHREPRRRCPSTPTGGPSTSIHCRTRTCGWTVPCCARPRSRTGTAPAIARA